MSRGEAIQGGMWVGEVVEKEGHGREVGILVVNGCVGNSDIQRSLKNQREIAKEVLDKPIF